MLQLRFNLKTKYSGISQLSVIVLVMTGDVGGDRSDRIELLLVVSSSSSAALAATAIVCHSSSAIPTSEDSNNKFFRLPGLKWSISCLRVSHICTNPRPHTLHLNGFSPV